MSNLDPSMDPQRTERQLTEREIAVRDMFVGEYMKDFDPYRAVIRMGFLAAFAIEQAKIFMDDGYVLRKIEFLTRAPTTNGEEDKQAMLQNLRWLAHNGSTSSRAAATKLYMEAQGYIEKDGNKEELLAAKLIDAMKEFADKAPE